MNIPDRIASLKLGLFLVFFGFACGEAPPDDVLSFEERDDCVQMNAEPIPPTDSDPHIGFKNVYACNITEDELLSLQAQVPLVYPEDTLIIKTSRRAHQDYLWLIATARKRGGSWRWTEYKRNFENEDFLDIPVSQDVCTGCHKLVEANDFIYTSYANPRSK